MKKNYNYIKIIMYAIHAMGAKRMHGYNNNI